MGPLCLDRQTLEGSADLDWKLQDRVSDLGPPFSLIDWDVKYMQVEIYFIL